MNQLISPYCAPGLLPGTAMPNVRYSETIIVAKISDFLNVPITDMIRKTRERRIVEARQIAMYFLRGFTNLSLKEIGAMFGGRDHTTAIHSIQTVKDLMYTDKEYRKKVEKLANQISPVRD